MIFWLRLHGWEKANMPVVFVHGVATRQTPEYQALVRQRDALFQKLVLPTGAPPPFDPDWGSDAVTFDPKLRWIPTPDANEVFSTGTPTTGEKLGLAHIASTKPAVAIDVAFQAGLAARATDAVGLEDSGGLEADDLAAFEAAVKYLEAGADKDAFDPTRSDSEFFDDLVAELAPQADPSKPNYEAMGLTKNALSWLGKGVKRVANSVANKTSDAVLRLARRPLSNQVALFLGDIFVYLRWRETDSPNRIFKPIIRSLIDASKSRSPNDPLIVICHSLGGVVLYDLLTDDCALAEIKKELTEELVVDTWVTVGSQPSVFADMGLYAKVKKTADGRFPKPDPVRRWFNVFDYTDALSFCCEPFFAEVEDFEFDNVSSLLSAHSAYFQRPSFYSRLRARMKEAG
jgi:hypothetical protein